MPIVAVSYVVDEVQIIICTSRRHFSMGAILVQYAKYNVRYVCVCDCVHRMGKYQLGLVEIGPFVIGPSKNRTGAPGHLPFHIYSDASTTILHNRY